GWGGKTGGGLGMFVSNAPSPAPGKLHFRKSSLELRDQSRQSLGLLIRGEVTAWQPLDLEAELAQPFLREGDLPMFKGIFVAAADSERKLIPIGSEQPAKVEPVALRFVIDHKTRCRRQEEQAVVAVHGVIQLADLGIRHLITF